MTSAPLLQSSSPQIPLDLLLLISSYTTLSTLSALSRTCRILHTHLASRLRKYLVLSKAVLYFSNHDLYNLVLTCRTVHTLLAPVLNSIFVAAIRTFIRYAPHHRLRRTPFVVSSYWNRDSNMSYRGPGMLCYAAGNGFTEEVRQLLELREYAHSNDRGFGTPLSRAVTGGYVEIVKMLLEGGAWLPRLEKGDNGSEHAEEIKALLVMFGGVVDDEGTVVMEKSVSTESSGT